MVVRDGTLRTGREAKKRWGDFVLVDYVYIEFATHCLRGSLYFAGIIPCFLYCVGFCSGYNCSGLSVN